MNFSITQKLAAREYRKMMFNGLYRKPFYIFATVFGVYLLTTILLDHLKVVTYYDEFPLFELTCGIILLLMPALITMLAIKQFRSNQNFQNDMIFTFSDDNFIIQATTYKSEILWAHIKKQKEIGNFLILYHTKKFGNIIDKSNLTPDQLLFIKTKVTQK